jgi:hypothetical protein
VHRARPPFFGFSRALRALGSPGASGALSAVRPLSPLLVALLGVVAAASGPVACGSTAGSDALPPITGIVVRAETLTVGHGCGQKATQLFKYLVVVFGANPADTSATEKRRDELVAANVYDCFADGQFVELPVSGGSSDYALEIYAYNAAAYAAAGGDSAFKGIVGRLQGLRAAVQADGGAAEREAVKAELATLAATNPTFSTTCDAAQFPDVQSLAVCQPLALGSTALGAAPNPATVVVPAASFTGADGGVVRCDDQFTNVRYRYAPATASSGAFTEPEESRCSRLTDKGLEPLIITVSPATAPASYTFELALLRSDGSVFGQTTCGAETSPGITTSAVCKPVQ